MSLSRARHPRLPVAPPPEEHTLTARERQILLLVALGLTTSQIAGELAVSPHTVRNHLKNVYAKCGIHNRTQAVLHALRIGLLALNGRPALPPAQ